LGLDYISISSKDYSQHIIAKIFGLEQLNYQEDYEKVEGI